MYVNLQAARLMVWDAAHCIDSGSPLAAIKAPAAKTFATDAAIQNAEMAVKILGSYGITREYKTSKLLNDAWIGWPCDGTNDMLRLHMVNFLAGKFPGFGG
jgi:alkylation response protein AidB-like acyl-CoA dehydrogenase